MLYFNFFHITPQPINIFKIWLVELKKKVTRAFRITVSCYNKIPAQTNWWRGGGHPKGKIPRGENRFGKKAWVENT